jgi:hypothetical protein
VAPGFIFEPLGTALAVSALWLLSITIPIAALARTRLSAGRAGLASLAFAPVALLAIAVGAPGLPGVEPPEVQALETQSEWRLLNDYRPSARPLALTYDSMRRVAPATLPVRATFVARPGDPRPQPPVRLLHDARWSLPAGLYTVELTVPAGAPTAAAASLALQLGRRGSPLERWAVHFADAGRWTHTFGLDIFVESVGFQGSKDLERLMPTITIRPRSVVDQELVPPRLEVLGAAQYGDARIYVHDDWTIPEPSGFWTRGQGSTTFTLAAAAAPRVKVRAGPIDTAGSIRISDRLERFALRPGETREFVAPDGSLGVWRVTVATDDAFVPAAIEAGSTDQRQLGCWLEVASQP